MLKFVHNGYMVEIDGVYAGTIDTDSSVQPYLFSAGTDTILTAEHLRLILNKLEELNAKKEE